MKNRIIRLLVEVIVIISGVALLLGFPSYDLPKSLAVGFITAGITSVLFEVILKDEFVDELKSFMHPPLKFIDIRENMDRIYLREFRSAKRIDIIALTSENLIRVCGELIAHKLLSERCEIRIAYLDPESEIWDYRLKIEPEISPKKLQQILKEAREFYEGIANSLLENASQIRGSLVVRAYDNIPYFAYFRADSKIMLGFYYSYIAGMKSHAFIAEEQKTNLFRKFEEHFEAVWRGPSKEIVSIYNRDIHVGEKLGHDSSAESKTAPNNSFNPTPR